MEISVNYLAVVLAAVSNMVIGFFWYSPFCFGKIWMRLKNFTKENLKAEQKKMGLYYAITFVLAMLTAYVLSHIMIFSHHFFGHPLVQTGLNSAFWVWLGFVMPVQATATIFGDKNWKLFGIDTGYRFVSLLLMGWILGALP